MRSASSTHHLRVISKSSAKRRCLPNIPLGNGEVGVDDAERIESSFVWNDGNRFRYVHYELARAIQANQLVTFDYFLTPHIQTAQALSRMEQLEIADSVIRYHNAGHYDYCLLNSMDNLSSPVHSLTEPSWIAVQRVV